MSHKNLSQRYIQDQLDRAKNQAIWRLENAIKNIRDALNDLDDLTHGVTDLNLVQIHQAQDYLTKLRTLLEAKEIMEYALNSKKTDKEIVDWVGKVGR